MYRLPPLQPNVWKAKPAFLGYFIVLHSEMLSALDSLWGIAAHREAEAFARTIPLSVADSGHQAFGLHVAGRS